MESSTLDKLYLEWSQFTLARTIRELHAHDLLSALLKMSNINQETKERISKVLDELAP